MLVYYGKTVGWIKMKFGMEVGGPRPRPRCVRWGPSSSKKGTAPNFRSMSVVAKRLMD